MKIFISTILSIILFTNANAMHLDSLRSVVLNRITPQSLIIQYAGNIGMFSIGARYESPNQKWQGSLHYGHVPASFADKAIHSTTIKVNYIPIRKVITNDVNVDWLKIGLWSNYAYGKQYFRKLPAYYDSGYYYFPTAVNIGLTFGSEIKRNKWGFYYEVGTTEKTVINFVKSPHASDFLQLWNIGLGISYQLK